MAFPRMTLKQLRPVTLAMMDSYSLTVLMEVADLLCGRNIIAPHELPGMVAHWAEANAETTEPSGHITGQGVRYRAGIILRIRHFEFFPIVCDRVWCWRQTQGKSVKLPAPWVLSRMRSARGLD